MTNTVRDTNSISCPNDKQVTTFS